MQQTAAEQGGAKAKAGVTMKLKFKKDMMEVSVEGKDFAIGSSAPASPAWKRGSQVCRREHRSLAPTLNGPLPP